MQQLAALRDTLKGAKLDYWATEVEVSRLGAAAWVAWARGRHDDAVALMRSAADMEDKSEKHIVTPGRIVPARELLGDMLLQLKRPAEAVKEFEASQRREPDRFRGLYGTAQAAAQSGGIVLAQDRAEARHASMPRTAITRNVVDAVLTLDELAAVLPRLAVGETIGR